MTKNTALPIIDFQAYFSDDKVKAYEECVKLSNALHDYGSLLIRDPRVSEEINEKFLDAMELYYSQTEEAKMNDIRPNLAYQVGATPPGIEIPRCASDLKCLEMIEGFSDENKPQSITGPDPKWRFFWHIGDIPTNTNFPELNSAHVIPKSFPNWKLHMDSWGKLMLDAVETSVEMAAIGFDIEKDAFTARMKNGPHLLAPTGSDLEKNRECGTVLAGFHYDLSFMTIHGKARYPGLYIWTRNGQKIKVKVPNGCLLLQAGKEMEVMTAGYVMAGYHEVIVTEDSIAAAKKAKSLGRPCWRVSSTLFAHIQSDVVLEPVGHFKILDSASKYPSITAGEFVIQELNATNLRMNV